jgi:hypothetical protein
MFYQIMGAGQELSINFCIENFTQWAFMYTFREVLQRQSLRLIIYWLNLLFMVHAGLSGILVLQL